MFSWLTEIFVKRGLRVLIIVDQDELAEQTILELHGASGLHSEREQGPWRASLSADIVVSTVQTLSGRLDKFPKDHFGLIIVDEADRSISPQWQGTLQHFAPQTKVCGFTATPHRTDLVNLGVFYENVIELENLFSLINKGFLCPVTVKMIPVKIDLSGVSPGDDYSKEDCDSIITPHLEEIAKQILIHGSFRRTLVFLPLVETCRKFDVIARDVGLKSDFIYGKDSDRDSKLQRFKDWNFDVLANSMLITRGVNIPGVDCMFIGRFTKSITLYMQMVGRGTRICKGKSDLLLLDPFFHSMKKLVCRPAHLIAKSEEEAESITKLLDGSAGLPAEVVADLPMDLQSLAGEATAQREEALRKKLEEHRNKAAKTISAAEFALQHKSMATAEFEPTMEWERKPVSDKQAKYIKQAGIDLESVNGAGHASKLLSLYFGSKELKMATHATRAALKRMGHPNWANATEREAKTFFAENRKPKTEEMFA